MEMTVDNICGLLVRSKLLTSDGVKSMHERWRSESKGSNTSASHFGKWLVSNQYVTAYQSALLARGHLDGYFLGEYKILDRLGKGRMAGVYKGLHSTGATVAIKVLPPSRTKDPQLFGRFQREAKLAVRLNHPNIVRAFDVGDVNGVHYIVMEHLDGETFEDVLLRRQKLPAAEGVRLVYQALMGLQHIHEQGLVHRDMKPSNMMLVPRSTSDTLRCTLKILDIGLGRELFDESGPAVQDYQLTSEGVLLGTPDYLAPEQARDAHASDIRADIYSLGCVLYHVLTGQPPFPDTNIISQMVRHATETPRPLRELNPTVPDGLQLVSNFMLAKEPAQRYQTPERAALALKPFMPATQEPLYSIEDDPRFSSYLKWLERGKPSSAPAAAIPIPPPAIPVSAAARSGVPVGIPIGSAPEEARMDPHRKKHGQSHKHKKHRDRSDLPVARPVGSGRVSSKDVDVELIPVAAAAGSKKRKRWLTGRDWILLGVGAFLVIAVALAAFVVAPMLSGTHEEPEDEPSPQPAPKVKEKEKEKTKDDSEAKDKDKEMAKDKDKDKEITKDKDKEMAKDKDKMSKEMEKDKDKTKDKDKDKDKTKDKDKDKTKEKE